MTTHLTELRAQLSQFAENRTIAPPPGISIFQCYQPQKYNKVSFITPMLLMVVSGEKRVQIAEQDVAVPPGEILLFPGGASTWMGNIPESTSNCYQGITLSFDQATLKHFRTTYGHHLEQWDLTPQWRAQPPKALPTLLGQTFELALLQPMDALSATHRKVEILLSLATAGLAGNILLNEHPSWKQRVSQLLVMTPSRSWQLSDVGQHLGISEASLRRKLSAENTGFRELLEEIRLTVGLSMLLETHYSIGQVADASGYQSQSRFSERFKRHYGMTPSQVRRTLSKPETV